MNGWKCQQKWASSFGDKYLMHTWKYATRTQKFSFSVHMQISLSSELLRMAGWEGEFVSSRSLDRLDEGDRSQGRGCVQGQSLFLCTSELTLTGTCKQGKYFLAPWRLTFPPHADPHSIISGVFTQPKIRGSEGRQKYKNFAQSFNKHFFLLLQPETWGNVSDLSLWQV